MDVDDFTDWLVKQLWPDLDPYMKTIEYASKWHAVRNYLLATYDGEDND